VEEKMNKLRRIIMVFLALFIAGLTVCTTPTGVQAAKILQQGMIEGVIDDDLIVVAKDVVINGTVTGSVLAIGATITVNGTIVGDAFLFGGVVKLSQAAAIQGNLFTAAASLDLRGTITHNLLGGSQNFLFRQSAVITGNVYFGGFGITTYEGSMIGKDLTAAASQIVLHGSIKRDVNLSGNAIEVFGTIDGNVSIDVSAPGEKNFLLQFIPNMPAIINTGLRIDPTASIGGTLKYTSIIEQSDAIHGDLASPAVYQTPVPAETQRKSAELSMSKVASTSSTLAWIWNFLRKMITFLLLGAIVLWFYPRGARFIKDRLISHPLPSLGIGFLVWIIGVFAFLMLPIIYILLGLLFNFISLGGLSFTWFFLIGAVLLLCTIFFFWLVFVGSGLIASYAFGDWLLEKISPNANGRKFLAMLFGILLFVFITSAPYIGWLCTIIASVIGLGAMWISYRNARHKKKAKR
jgi:hypothetical protein